MISLFNGPSRAWLTWPWSATFFSCVFIGASLANRLAPQMNVQFLNPLLILDGHLLILVLAGFLFIGTQLELRLGSRRFLALFLGCYLPMVASEWFRMGMKGLPTAGTGPLMILLAAGVGAFQMKPWYLWAPGKYKPLARAPSALLFIPLLWGLEYLGLAGLQGVNFQFGSAHLSLVFLTFILFSRQARKIELPSNHTQLAEQNLRLQINQPLLEQLEIVKKRFVANPLCTELFEGFLWTVIKRPSTWISADPLSKKWLERISATVGHHFFKTSQFEKLQTLIQEGKALIAPEHFLRELTLQEMSFLHRYFLDQQEPAFCLLLLIAASNRFSQPSIRKLMVETAEGLIYREMKRVRRDGPATERFITQLKASRHFAKCPTMIGMLEDQVIHFGREDVAS